MKAPSISVILLASILGLLRTSLGTRGADWPMLGRDGTRNAVSPEVGAPTIWCIEQRDDSGRLIRAPRGIRWTAPLGSQTYSSSVVSSGLLWIGTNNSRPGVKASEAF
jgi:hypothetical protein